MVIDEWNISQQPNSTDARHSANNVRFCNRRTTCQGFYLVQAELDKAGAPAHEKCPH